MVDRLLRSGMRCKVRAVVLTGGMTERSEGVYDMVPRGTC